MFQKLLVNFHYIISLLVKLNKISFPSALFNVSNYEIKNRRDMDQNSANLFEFLRKRFITKRLKDYETQISETICSEFTVPKKKMDLL